ncbi:MAG: cytochrome c [Rhodospirillaceae bacterium]
MAFIAVLFGASEASADGQASYLKHCSLCHQADAQGIPGTFPRLMGRVGQIGSSAEGAAFMAQAILWGMSGTITVDDVPLTGVMPGVPHVSDEEILSIVEYLATEGGTVKNATMVNLETIKAARAGGRIPQAATNARRQELSAAGIIK